MHLFEKHQYSLFLIGLFFYLTLFFLVPINLFTADLGRHLVNGREVLALLPARSAVLDTNFYSYTHPDFPFINHHWFYGVVIWPIYLVGGFTLLQFVNALVKSLAVVLMIFGLSRLRSNLKNWFSLLLATFLIIPLVTFRTEVRPETFSLLFSSLVYLGLLAFWQRKIRLAVLLAVLLPLQIFWVNLHIFFFFSYFIIAAFWLTALVKRNWQILSRLTLVGGLLILVNLINPFGFKLLIFPTQILKDYGYMIAENQTIWFMLKRFYAPTYFYSLGLILTLVVIFVTNLFFRWFKVYWHNWILAFGFLGVSFKMNRLLPFFGLFLLPVLFVILNQLRQFVVKRKYFVPLLNKKVYFAIPLTVIGLMSFLGVVASGIWLPPLTRIKFGTLPNTGGLSQFLTQSGLKDEGKIFNNYDIGGYLIFSLFPQNQVYVDNRPEAYPSKFLTDEYVKSQEDESSWQALEKKYRFRAIVFYRLDQTPWAQPFLIKRIKDKDWVPVYVDDFSLVLVKNDKQNQTLINTYRLPENLFRF